MKTPMLPFARIALKFAMLAFVVLCTACAVQPRRTGGIHILSESGMQAVLRTNALPPLSYWDYGQLQARNGERIQIYEYVTPDGWAYTFLCNGSIWELVVTKK